MKKGNLFLLVLFVILFIVSVIPMFNSMNSATTVYFFSDKTRRSFSSVYMPILVLGIIEGALLVLYLISLFKDIKRQDATKFELK